MMRKEMGLALVLVAARRLQVALMSPPFEPETATAWPRNRIEPARGAARGSLLDRALAHEAAASALALTKSTRYRLPIAR